MLMRHVSCVATLLENASSLPSGDHCSPDGLSVRCEICVVAPSASIQRTKICELPLPLGSPFATYATRLPSGDHCASAPCVSARGCDPPAFLSHNDVPHRSSILATQRL